MTMDERGSRPGLARLVRRSSFFKGESPREISRDLSPVSLRCQGFERSAKCYYSKSRFGVLALTIGIVPCAGKPQVGWSGIFS